MHILPPVSTWLSSAVLGCTLNCNDLFAHWSFYPLEKIVDAPPSQLLVQVQDNALALARSCGHMKPNACFDELALAIRSGDACWALQLAQHMHSFAQLQVEASGR